VFFVDSPRGLASVFFYSLWLSRRFARLFFAGALLGKIHMEFWRAVSLGWAFSLGCSGCGGASAPAATSAESAPAAPPALSPNAPAAGGTQIAPALSSPLTLSFPRSSTPWLGVELKATQPAQAGALVSLVFPGSPAAKAGLAAGDVLLSIDGLPVQGPTDVATAVQKRRVGAALPLTFLRAGASRLVRVDLEGMPEFEDRIRLAFVGRPAPEIAGVTTFQGETSALSEVRGQVVVLEFWASWCGPCRLVSPTLDRWHRLYKPQGAEVIGITVDAPAEGAEVARHTGMSYTLAHDPAGRATRTYLASQVPMLVLIDKHGVVRDVMVGASPTRLADVEKLLQALLEEPG